MPKPSDVAKGSYNFKDYLISYDPTEYDMELYSQWLDAEQPTYLDALVMICAAEWKLSITPKDNGNNAYYSVTCKRANAYLNGFTLSLTRSEWSWGVHFCAFLVVSLGTLHSGQIDGVLDSGLGSLKNLPRNAKSSTDDEIPF
jgi:hypothetical protein